MLGGDFQVLHCIDGETTFLLSYGRTMACGKGAATGLPDCRLIVNNGTAGPSFGNMSIIHHRDGQRHSGVSCATIARPSFIQFDTNLIQTTSARARHREKKTNTL